MSTMMREKRDHSSAMHVLFFCFFSGQGTEAPLIAKFLYYKCGVWLDYMADY